jgi:hypothetical protein
MRVLHTLTYNCNITDGIFGRIEYISAGAFKRWADIYAATVTKARRKKAPLNWNSHEER